MSRAAKSHTNVCLWWSFEITRYVRPERGNADAGEKVSKEPSRRVPTMQVEYGAGVVFVLARGGRKRAMRTD
jgi:hypothetical protein